MTNPSAGHLAAARELVKPLTYEQEVHAVLCHAAAASADLIRYFEAQAQHEKGDARRLTKKCIANEQYALQRVRDLIPQALERRDAKHFPEPAERQGARESAKYFYDNVYSKTCGSVMEFDNPEKAVAFPFAEAYAKSISGGGE